jgi:2-aminoadipate transaminase
VLQLLRDTGRDQRLAGVVAAYRRKRDYFAIALRTHFGNLATWRMPPGGLFFWLTLASHMDTRTVLPEAIRRGVAFMPGEPFYPELPKSCGALRLNFSHASEEQIERGLSILAELLGRENSLTKAG